MMLLIESAIKVAFIVLVALGLMPLLRSRAAALRHWILAAALISAAAAPAVRMVMPSWRVPIDVTASTRPVALQSRAAAVATSIGPAPAGAHEGGSPTSSFFGTLLLVIWAAGAALGVGVLAIGLARLARLASAARRISDGVWMAPAEEIRREYGLRPPVLLQSDHPALLVTWGVRQPKVLLPAGAQAWPEDRVRLVLAHELAHVRRGDWVVQLAAELLRAVYWVNPIMWIACRRLRQESEQACDDAVLNRGADGSDYAAHLVDIARELQPCRTWVPAPSMARRSNLERRVRAMLDTRVNRRPISRFSCAATLVALLAVAVPVAVAQAVFATVAGSIVDPLNGAVPGVTLVLANVQNDSKYEVRSDRTGRYEFVGVAAGDYLLEARLPGFAVLRGRLTVGGQNVQQDLKLDVGTLSETVTLRASASSPDSAVGTVRSDRAKAREAPTCGSGPGQEGTPIGGNIRPPRKLLDVRPNYPASAVRAGVQGTVTLQGRIGTDGRMEDLTIVSTPHADLASAAMDAVRQWEFDGTYLNCVAIPVNIGIAVTFELED